MSDPSRRTAQRRAEQEVHRRERQHTNAQQARQDAANQRAAAQLAEAYDLLLDMAQRCGAPLLDLRAEPGTLHATLLGHPLRATNTSVQRRLADATWGTLHPDDWVTLPSLPPAPPVLQGQPVPTPVRARLHRITLLARAAAPSLNQMRLLIVGSVVLIIGYLLTRMLCTSPAVLQVAKIIFVTFAGLMCALVVLLLWGLEAIATTLTRRLARDLSAFHLLPDMDESPEPEVPLPTR